jgi:hypothetical protein
VAFSIYRRKGAGEDNDRGGRPQSPITTHLKMEEVHIVSHYYCNIPKSDLSKFNPLTPNGHYSGRTAPLTSRHSILNIYSTNIRTEYFKHAAQSPVFSLKNAVYFIMLPCLVPVLFTF